QNREVKEQAKALTEGIAKRDLIAPPEQAEVAEMKKNYTTYFDKAVSLFDFEKGGINRAPKFPMPVVWEWLLQDFHLRKNEKALEAVQITLKNMAFGGINDQIGGGFARYATDTGWRIPHFEKMLYDNAQLVSVYSHAFQIVKDPIYEKVIHQTLNFVEREL